jgi:hypothetical protein
MDREHTSLDTDKILLDTEQHKVWRIKPNRCVVPTPHTSQVIDDSGRCVVLSYQACICEELIIQAKDHEKITRQDTKFPELLVDDNIIPKSAYYTDTENKIY